MTELTTMPPKYSVVAVNATEMMEAQKGIKSWLQAKLVSLDLVVNETQAAFDVAKKNKWNTKVLRSALSRETQRQLYYSKLLAAVEAGFTIVPNMEMDVFAVRINREKPSVPAQTITRSYKSIPMVNDQMEQQLKIGEGRYESPVVESETEHTVNKNEKGENEHTVSVRPVGFTEIDFPLAIANAEVMNVTAQAMSLKLFDIIGMVPASVTAGDPIVLGQIKMKSGWGAKRASFLIAWYLDARTL